MNSEAEARPARGGAVVLKLGDRVRVKVPGRHRMRTGSVVGFGRRPTNMAKVEFDSGLPGEYAEFRPDELIVIREAGFVTTDERRPYGSR